MSDLINSSFNKLYAHLQKLPLDERFKGYDPFDGLNSPFVSKSFLGRSRLIRLLVVQFFKRSPINFRKMAFIKPGYNAQALGRFLEGYCLLYAEYKREEDLEAIEFLLKRIEELRIAGYSGACWGYNFDWQARAFYQPKDTPMIVPTTSVFGGLIAAYKILKRDEILNTALSVGKFIEQDLNKTYEGENFAFSYSPLDTSVVYNASLMATRVLSKIYEINGDTNLLSLIKTSTKFCLIRQNEDGSWTYGEKPYHQWIDNFHSGYNLECLTEIVNSTGLSEYQSSIDKGLKYYTNTFFDDKGRSRYYFNSLYPIDINNPAQLLITLMVVNKKSDHAEITDRVISWTVANLQHKEGYFFYRRYKYYSNRINYIRWSQAWMFFSMTKFLFGRNE
jgi:hypothetical protein